MTDAVPSSTTQDLRGPVGDSEHQGYIRFFTSESRSTFYDLPLEWILLLEVGGAGTTGPGAKPAYPGGDTGTPLDFEQFRREITEETAPRGDVPPGG